MSLPQPLHPLTDHCTIINNHTLYAYSPTGFQSLSLSEGAEWQDLPMGVSVTGGQCVKATAGDDPNAASLYIVGGSVNDTASSWNYPGLQRFSFADQTWEWITPVVTVTQNRQNHAATFLNASQSILVYSGSQTTGDNGPSSATFVISTTPPFSVLSFNSAAPPGVKPMLMPWDASHAVMFGGGDSNEAVFTFGPDDGWRDVGTTLTSPLTNSAQVQCTVVSGDDGSKVLERYDMSISPNKVERIVLLGAGGVPAAPGTTVGKKVKRDFTISGWPSYNGSLAPTATRSGFSVAQDSNGVSVISGGTPDDPLCIFDQKANSWVNATQLFEGSQIIIQSTPSASASSLPVSTSAAPSSTTSAAAASAAAPNHKSRMLTVLGATLGTIFGIAAILVVILLLLRWKREKRKRERQAGYIEKDRMSFADVGAGYMSEAGGAPGTKFRPSMNPSQSSLAIISGRGGHKRGIGPLGSDASTAGLVTKKSPLGYADPVEMANMDLKVAPMPVVEEKPSPPRTANAEQPARTGPRSRSSGWSRYFANNEATNLANMPSARSTYASERTSLGSESHYTDSRIVSQPQSLPPLQIPKFENERISRVVTASPTLGHSSENLPGQPMQAELARANSVASSVSSFQNDDSTGYTRDVTVSWTPVSGNQFNQRPPSSAYTESNRVSEFNDGTSSFYYNDGTSSLYPRTTMGSLYPLTMNFPAVPDGRDSTMTAFPGAIPAPDGEQRQNSLYPSRLAPAAAPQGRESTVTMFPRGGDEPQTGPKRQVGINQDMSWLNLGAGT